MSHKQLARLCAAFIFGICSVYSLAEDSTTPSVAQLALAAGYKAQFVCSATFNGGKTLPMIEAQELSNISADLQPLLRRVGEPRVNPKDRTVSVAYADDVPPRIAAWRPHLGCSGLPPGARAAARRHLPRIAFTQPVPDQSSIVWPAGDQPQPLTPAQQARQQALTTAIAGAFAGDFGGVTSAVLIVKDGAILGERYLPGFDHTTSQRT